MDTYCMLKSHLKENKINVEIKPNNMNECKISVTKTKNHDALFGSLRARRNRDSYKPHSDSLMYLLMIMQEPTLSLLKPHDTMKRVDNFKQIELKDRLMSKEIKVVKPFKVHDVIKAIDATNRSEQDTIMILSCIGEHFKLNLCANGKLAYCYDHNVDKYVDILIDSKSPENKHHEDGFINIVTNAIIPNGLEKLKSTLVKDLKTYAAILKIQGVSKLSKQDLIDQITNTLRHHT